MDIEELKNKFFDMEIKNHLFEKRTSENLPWWDIVRYEVFQILLYKFNVRKITPPSKSPNIVKKTKKIIRLFYNEILYRSNISHKDYIFYMASRNVGKNGYSYDIISDELYNQVSKKSLIIESSLEAKRQEFVYYNFSLLFYKKIRGLSPIKKKYNLNIDIEEKLYETFGEKVNIKGLIDKTLTNFEIDYNYYIKLFNKIKPKIIFFVMNGIQKGMVSAANDLNIPTVELQHGLCNEFHMAYSYPKEVCHYKLKTIPTYFFTFGSFWNRINYPVKKKITIGNNFYSCFLEESNDSKKGTLIVLANIYTEVLLNLAKEILKRDKKGYYIIKLHPNQIKEKKVIERYFYNYPNVEIIGTEKNIPEILAKVENVLAIQSTVLYEALQRKKKIIIYKKYDYIMNRDLFNFKNVYLVSNHMEALQAIKKEYIEDEEIPVFFQKFDKNRFLEILKQIETESI